MVHSSRYGTFEDYHHPTPPSSLPMAPQLLEATTKINTKNLLEKCNDTGMALPYEHVALSWKNQVNLEFCKGHAVGWMFLSQVSLARNLVNAPAEASRD